MATVTLDEIRAAAEEKYGSFDIPLSDGTVVVLLNPLRLSKDVRKGLETFQDRMKAEGADQVALLKETLLSLAKDKRAGQKLLREIGDDLPVLIETFSRYAEATKVGEASASRS